ncbi:MAG: tetratricopeptide repeat protein [Alphaproteobacteria bacterium]|nr:tetratricopeptide repeat protein [Alphaproteobacteria bacterium]
MIEQIDNLIKRRQLQEAERLCRQRLEVPPENSALWFRLGQIQQMKGDFDGMLKCARRVIALDMNGFSGYLQEIDALIHGGKIDQAIRKIALQEDRAGNNGQLLGHLAEFYTHAGQFQAANRCYQRLRGQQPDNPEILYNCAAAAIALGDFTAAEQLFDQVVALNPHDYDACYSRATLRRQTADNNHIDDLQTRIKRGIRHRAGEVQVYYALAKEYEDIGDYKKSFACLTKGASRRNTMLSYDVAQDEAAMTALTETMNADFFDGGINQQNQPGPIFIVGLPRSGTTLVDRILSCHSAVDSLGEINDFALTLMSMTGPVSGKIDLIRKSATIDFQRLGQKYLTRIRSRNSKAPTLIDKTPVNYLYVGLIAKSLPTARIIHLRRGPMDSCYAMYKTLFRMGYPFSYSQENLARYYIAYHQLMAHWRRLLPGRILDIDYEALVQDPENVSRWLMAHCDLDWQPQCLDFHLNTSPTATASAAQVRQPLYRTSIDKWRRYQKELRPLRKMLTAADLHPETRCGDRSSRL